MSLAWASLNGVHAKAQPAHSVTILYANSEDSISGAMVYIDREVGLVHVLDHDGQTHLLTVPIARTIIEWQDSSERGGRRHASQ